MKHIRILAVGKLKMPHWRAASDFYQKRLAHSCKMEETLIRDAEASLLPEEKKRREGERLLRQFRQGDLVICLDETGRTLSSTAFSRFLFQTCEPGKTACFVIGGAFGLDTVVKEAANHVLSLGPMTLPHELARVVLLEQLYRAESILAGTGYHH